MLNALPASLGLPPTTNAANAAQSPSLGSGQDGALQTSERSGGFARALERAAADEAPQEAQRTETTEPTQASTEATPRDEPTRRQGPGKTAAGRSNPALRSERGLGAAAVPGVPAGHEQALEALTPGWARATSAPAEDAPSNPATSPENGGVGALLLQLRAAAEAATPGDPAAVADAAKSDAVKAGPSDGDKLAIDAPGARRSAAQTRGGSTRQAPGADPMPVAAGSETGLSQSLYPPSSEASQGQRFSPVAFAAEQPIADATQPLSPPAGPAGLTAGNAPTVFGGAGPSNNLGEARLSASPGSPDFGPQLGAHVTTFVRDGLEHARLQLHPADMGPVLVQIQLDGQTAQVHLSAENAVTRQALEDALPQLASQLREAGLTLSGGGVSEQAQQGRQAPSDNPARSTSTPGAARPVPQELSRAPVRRGVVDLVA